MEAPGGGGHKFHTFFGMSVHRVSPTTQARVAFAANHECPTATGEHKICIGTYIAQREGGKWAIRLVAGPSDGFVGMSDPTLGEGVVAFVAMDTTGAEGIYSVDLDNQTNTAPRKVAYAGQVAPGGLGHFASFPQPPAVDAGAMVFRAYTDVGETGIFHAASASSTVSKLVSTRDTLEAGRSVVYLGSGERSFMMFNSSKAVFAFYASSVGVNNTNGWDGIYMGQVGI